MKTIFRILIVLVVFWGCEKKIIEDLPVEIPDNLTFSEHIQPFFTGNCVDCHKSASSPGSLDLTEGNSFNSITSGGKINTTDAKESSLYIYVKDGHQKGGPGIQDPTIAAYILAWVEQGALDN
jgi:hypothetical protein